VKEKNILLIGIIKHCVGWFNKLSISTSGKCQGGGNNQRHRKGHEAPGRLERKSLKGQTTGKTITQLFQRKKKRFGCSYGIVEGKTNKENFTKGQKGWVKRYGAFSNVTLGGGEKNDYMGPVKCP